MNGTRIALVVIVLAIVVGAVVFFTRKSDKEQSARDLRTQSPPGSGVVAQPANATPDLTNKQKTDIGMTLVAAGGCTALVGPEALPLCGAAAPLIVQGFKSFGESIGF